VQFIHYLTSFVPTTLLVVNYLYYVLFLKFELSVLVYIIVSDCNLDFSSFNTRYLKG
jgi:hypothetical protein